MFSEPVIGERFFGRDEVLELLTKRVSALKDGYRQNIAFTGQSLAGKTSILHHFLYTIKDDTYIAVYVEIVKEPFRSFANKFIATLLYNALRKTGEETDMDMDALLERGQKAFPKTCQAIKHVYSAIEKNELDEAYSSLLGLTSMIRGEIDMPCIVILDEFDNLEQLGLKNPFTNFGKVIMVQKDTMYIVTSSRNSAIKKILSEKLSLLFGNFEIVRISGFGLKAASRFIDVKLGGYDIDDRLKKFLMAFADGNPFYLNRLIERAKSDAAEKMSNHIDIDIIAGAVREEIYKSNGAIHQYLINFLLDLIDTRCRESFIAIMTAISNGRNKKQDVARSLKAKPGEISNGLTKLTELGFISKHGVFYRIDDVMLEFWLKHVYKRRRELLVDDIFNKEKLFTAEIKSYISDFMTELDKDVTSRITELFNLFSNELVPINSKHIRLPHFTKVDVKAFPYARSFIAATFRGRSWIVAPHENEVTENDIIDYVRSLKVSGCKVSDKVIIPTKGIEENAKLLAKELKIAIWDLSTVNALLTFYNKKRLVVL